MTLSPKNSNIYLSAVATISSGICLYGLASSFDEVGCKTLPALSNVTVLNDLQQELTPNGSALSCITLKIPSMIGHSTFSFLARAAAALQTQKCTSNSVGLLEQSKKLHVCPHQLHCAFSFV